MARGARTRRKQRGAGFFNTMRRLVAPMFTRKGASAPAPVPSIKENQYNLFPGALPQPKRTWKNWFLRRKPKPLPIEQPILTVPTPIENSVTRYMKKQPNTFASPENLAFNIIRKNGNIQRRMANLNRKEYATYQTNYQQIKRQAYNYTMSSRQNLRNAHNASFGWLYTLLKGAQIGRSFEDTLEEINEAKKQILITPDQMNELREIVLEKIYNPQTNRFNRTNLVETIFGDEDTYDKLQNAYTVYETFIPADGSEPMKPFTYIHRLLGALFYTDAEYEIILHEDDYHCRTRTGFLPHSLTTSPISGCIYIVGSLSALHERFSGENMFDYFFISFHPSVLPTSRYTDKRQPYTKLSSLNVLFSKPFTQAIQNGLLTAIDPRLGLLLQLEMPDQWKQSYPIYTDKNLLEKLMILFFQLFVILRRYLLTQNTTICMDVYKTDYKTYKQEIRNLHWGASSWTNSSWKFNESLMDLYIQQMQTWLLGDDISKHIYSGYRDKKFDFLFGTDYIEDYEQKDPFLMTDTFPWLQAGAEDINIPPLPQENRVRQKRKQSPPNQSIAQTPVEKYIQESITLNQPTLPTIVTPPINNIRATPNVALTTVNLPNTGVTGSAQGPNLGATGSAQGPNIGSGTGIIRPGTVANLKAKFQPRSQRRTRRKRKN